MSTHDILDQREADHAIRNYTRVPNMLVDGYQDLHPQDKWLFVCLVRLCGKEGTRYLSLRFIAKKTGFSPSVLSDNKKNGKPGMIGRLHDSGLIHAEIKRRLDGDGEEEKQAQYHITITNTWALNYEYYNPGDCSISEQSDNESVLNQNATVLKQNAIDEKCSESERNCSKTERECSDSSTIVRLQSNTTNKITEESKITSNVIVESASADIDATSPAPLSQPLQEKKRGTRKKPQPPTEQKEIPFEEMPWCAEKALSLTEKLVDTKYRNQENEVKACRDIFKKYNPTEEVYVRVVQKILPWYQDHKKLLHPTDLAAKTQRGRIRFEELLEEIEYQDSRPARPRPMNANGMTTKHGQRPEDYEQSELSRNSVERIQQAIAKSQARKAEAAKVKEA